MLKNETRTYILRVTGALCAVTGIGLLLGGLFGMITVINFLELYTVTMILFWFSVIVHHVNVTYNNYKTEYSQITYFLLFAVLIQFIAPIYFLFYSIFHLAPYQLIIISYSISIITLLLISLIIVISTFIHPYIKYHNYSVNTNKFKYLKFHNYSIKIRKLLYGKYSVVYVVAISLLFMIIISIISYSSVESQNKPIREIIESHSDLTLDELKIKLGDRLS